MEAWKHGSKKAWKHGMTRNHIFTDRILPQFLHSRPVIVRCDSIWMLESFNHGSMESWNYGIKWNNITVILNHYFD